VSAPVIVRPPVPHFPHSSKPKETKAEETKPVKKELTEEEKLHYQEVISKRIKDAMKQKVNEKKQEENNEKQKKEKLEKFLQDYQVKLQEQKRALKEKKKEERKQKKLEQLQKSVSVGQMNNDEKEEDESEEENEDEGEVGRVNEEGKEKKVLTKKFISSAPEIFENLLEDFEFEEFISKPSLLQLYSPSEEKEKETENHDEVNDEDSLPIPAVSATLFPSSASPMDKYTALALPHQHVKEEKKASSYKINRAALRVPKSLKDTPYFQHYVKHTHSKQKEMKKRIEGADADKHFNKEAEKISKHHEEDKKENHHQNEEEEEEEINSDSLLEMIMKAQEKKYQQPQQLQQPSKHQQSSLDISSQFTSDSSSSSVVYQQLSTKDPPQSHSTMTSLSTLQMDKLPASSGAPPPPSVKLPKFQPSFNLSSMPSAPTLPSSSFVQSNDAFQKGNDYNSLSHQATTAHTSSSPALSSLPVPDLTSIQNIKARYGIALFDFGSKQSQNNNLMMFGGGSNHNTSNQQHQHHNHVGIMKKLKMKKGKKSSRKEKEKENEEKEKKPGFLQKRSSVRALLNDKIVKEVETSPVEGDPNDQGEEGMLRLSKRKANESQSLRYSSLPPSTYDATSEVSFKDSFPVQDDEGDDDESRPSASANGKRKGNKVREKISELVDYEDQLQKDYETLRNQFTNRLQQITKENQQTMKSSSSSLQQSAKEEERKSPTSLFKEETNDLRSSVTESYMRESSGGEGVSTSQNKVSTKELLLEWALEDAIENGEITDGELVALHAKKNKKYYDNEEEEGEEEVEGDQDEYEGEEEGPYEQEEGDDDEEYPGDHYDQTDLAGKKEVTYDDDSYYDRCLSSLHDEVVHRNSSNDAIQEDEEGDEDDHRAMRSERKEYWKQVVSAPPTVIVGESKVDLDDNTCLDMMKALSSKIKCKK
jgi:hypothetical protein